MGEYARVYGEDGFKMADGTRKITKYDMTTDKNDDKELLLVSNPTCINVKIEKVDNDKLIAYKYQIGQLVLYDNSGTDTNRVDGRRSFTTYVYCYDKSKCQVSTNTIPGFVHDIGASGNAGVIVFRDQSHFNLFEFGQSS